MPESVLAISIALTLAATVMALLALFLSPTPGKMKTTAFVAGTFGAATMALLLPGGPAEPTADEVAAANGTPAVEAGIPETATPMPTSPPPTLAPAPTSAPFQEANLPTPRVPLDTTCDGALRSAIQTTHGTYGTNRIRMIIGEIQARRQDCTQQYWDPDPLNADLSDMCGPLKPLQKDHVGGVEVPPELLRPTSFGSPRPGDTDSGGITRYNTRTQWGHAVIHWRETRQPHDGSFCWMRNAELDTWGAE